MCDLFLVTVELWNLFLDVNDSTWEVKQASFGTGSHLLKKYQYLNTSCPHKIKFNLKSKVWKHSFLSGRRNPINSRLFDILINQRNGR